MNQPQKKGPRSYTYSLPSICTKSKILQGTGSAIAEKFFRKYSDDIKPRFFSVSPDNSPSLVLNQKFLPYSYAQNRETEKKTAFLPVYRKSAEMNLLNNMQANQLRSYSDTLII